jgi:hypothetical protein
VSSWFDDIFPPEIRNEAEVAVENIVRGLNVMAVVCSVIDEVIDHRFPHA